MTTTPDRLDADSNTNDRGTRRPGPDRTVIALRALNGVVAAAVTIGVGQLVAALFDRAASPLYAVGAAVIDLTPKAVREFAISTFGTGDKVALLVGIGIIVAVLAVIAGVIERRARSWGSAMFAAFGVLGVAAAVTRPGGGVDWFVPTVVGVVAGIVFLQWMARRLDPVTEAIPDTTDEPGVTPEVSTTDRRAFLVAAGTAGAGAVIAGVGGVALDHRLNDVGRDRAGFVVPGATNSVDTAADGGDGLPSFITSNSDFYRIDTALSPPQITSGAWSLRVHGMVDREFEIDMAQLRRMPAIEKMVTLTCVSNEVGGTLIGNATWTGYRVRDLLARAGPSPDADMVLSRSSDGFTAGTPIEAFTDDRDSILAVAMNGSPLPVEHGYPARLVVPGLYGYVSATKWVTSLEVTRFDRAKAYWSTRGWSEKGPIKTSSRIDVPRNLAEVRAGRVMVGGVAWAQPRGINAVQVRVDDGAWRTATLRAPDLVDTWRLWSWEWDATPGDHVLTVRAIDGEGRQQSAVESRPDPDGATGLHSISVTVR
ncbi:molybdopterin-dependent oxidoreductase [Williamsia sp. MIQD14]|uniref:molybdopterin-dependent oxidoreductase n=1 Tax=Williamsia sp. MIQD14 TaxID=3425703 RepID=UPI003DA1C0BF